MNLFKRKPVYSPPLTQAEHAQRVEAARASAIARHRAETAPSVRQGSTGAPSKTAIALFRQGQARPDTRARRGPWDTRSSELPVGSIQAHVTFHFPKAYRSATPDPPAKGRALLVQALARKKKGVAQNLVIANPKTVVEAQRHPAMREIIGKTLGVIREHQAGAITRGIANGLIPEGTHPGLVAQAYKHAALHAVHKAGLLDYEPRMDAAAKAAFRPLVPFMRYANRRVFDKLNVENKGKWDAFREEFGTEYRQRKFGKETGHVRRRMRPNQEFIKIDLGDLEDDVLAKLDESAQSGEPSVKPGQKENENGHDAHSSAVRLGRLALARASAAHKAGIGTHAASGVMHIPEPPGGMPPPSDPTLHIKHAAIAVERHFGLPRIGGAREAPPAPREEREERAPLHDGEQLLGKIDFGFMLGTPSSAPNLGGYDTNPASQLRRAMRPRMKRQRLRLRLNTQRHMRRLLSGGVTRRERWLLGAQSGVPRDPFAIGKRAPLGKRSMIDDHADMAAHPTVAQAAAGNYRKGHTICAGLPMTIETPKGRYRTGLTPAGKIWRVKMPAHYGYIKRTTAADGEQLDVYLGPHAHEADKHPAFIVDQQHHDTKRFDEHKSMLGFRDLAHATKTYDAAFSDKRGPSRRRAIHEVTVADLRHWVANGDLSKPYGEKVTKQADEVTKPRSRLTKGLIGAAIARGAGHFLDHAEAAAHRASVYGRAALRAGTRRLAASPVGQHVGARLDEVARHPRVAPVLGDPHVQAGWRQARGIGVKGIFEPGATAGSIAGAAIGGARGARIGSKIGTAAEYAPKTLAIGGAVGAGLGIGRATAPKEKKPRKPRALAPPVSSPGMRKRGPKARTLFTTPLKLTLREHIRVLDGGTPGPHLLQGITRARNANKDAARQHIPAALAAIAGAARAGVTSTPGNQIQ